MSKYKEGMKMDTTVEVKQVSLTLQKTKILKNVDVTFQGGQIHGIVGRNGSGKTMLMKCICGFVKPSEGHIFVNEREVGKDMDFPENMGIIIETPGFIPYYSGYKNLKLLADLNKKIAAEKIKECMELVGLDPALKRSVKKYSLGMRQRLGIAQAIMEDPELLILDEPFNGLDEEGVNEMREVFLKLKKKGKNIILASHNKEDIEILCDTVHQMRKGEMTEA